ncbi:MAG: alpha-1,2-fucosyltransferase [Bacteroidetes bacterium]|nr:alpha-1,2-fucosyltransferase [Bacteroidota bacterium]
MVITNIIGGLGNQLFMYAAARRLAHIHNVPLRLDISGFKKDDKWSRLRTYRLKYFNIKAEIATTNEISRLKGINQKGVNWKILNINKRIGHYYRQSYVKERNFHFDPAILKLSGNVYMDGYWQSEKYFSDIEDIIRREFTLAESPDKLNFEFAKRIEKSSSISIHIRRGDYIEDSEALSLHGTLGLDYYSRAINFISEKVRDPHFYVFSDDYEGAKRNIKIDYPATFVKYNNAEKDYADLWLMSLCKHHIIAHSTFSWWGAWLNNNPDKMVIAPKRWFADEKMNSQTKDLIPEGWIRL